jgi:hypothetical protein
MRIAVVIWAKSLAWGFAAWERKASGLKLPRIRLRGLIVDQEDRTSDTAFHP